MIENHAIFVSYLGSYIQRELKHCLNAPLKIRHEDLKIEAPGPPNGSTSSHKNYTLQVISHYRPLPWKMQIKCMNIIKEVLMDICKQVGSNGYCISGVPHN